MQEIISELSDGELAYMLHLMADEVETRMVQHAGEPLELTKEEMERLPF